MTQKKDPRVLLISTPKKGDSRTSAMKFGPEDNNDVVSYMDAMTKFPLDLQRQKWSNEEKHNLGSGIKQEFQKALLKKSVGLISYSEGSFGTSSDIDNVMASIKGLEITPENIRAYLPKVNWDDFASVYNKGRSGAECEARWLNWEDPMKNNFKWTRTEDKELLLIVKEKEMSNWIDIAVSLGTNRTPFQCLARFQRSLNAQMVKREWEEEEDARLCAAVTAFGESNWQSVAAVLDRRTGTQCSNRWKKTLNPARLRVGRWTIDEDKRMRVSIKLFGAKCWKKIAQFVPGRTQVQCRERWVNCLDPSLKWDPWTEEEDAKLMTAIGEYNYCWSKVAAGIPPRTDNQCRRRWMALCPDDVLKLKAVKKIQQVALISNFVDRERERPDLGPEDFAPPPMLCAASEAYDEEPTRKVKRKQRENPALQLDSAGRDKTSGESRKKKRPRGRVKDVQMDLESTCANVDVNIATCCINDGTATIESAVIEVREPFECNEEGNCNYYSYDNLALTSTDAGGNPSVTNNSHKRKKYKPRRKALAASQPVQCMPLVSVTQSVSSPNNNTVCSEIAMVDNTTPVKKKRKNTSTQNSDQKKKSRCISKKNNIEPEAVADIQLRCQKSKISTSISCITGATSKNFNLGAENGTMENDEHFVDQSNDLLEDSDNVPLTPLIWKNKNNYLEEFENYLEAQGELNKADMFCHEQASASLNEDDCVLRASIIEKKRNFGGVLKRTLEQVGSRPMEDDTPLSIFVKQVKRNKKPK